MKRFIFAVVLLFVVCTLLNGGVVSSSLKNKRGVTLGCPKVKPGTVGICVERCSGDNDCPAGHLCCSNGCGHTCQPAFPCCPKLAVSIFDTGYKVGCHVDLSDCQNGQICGCSYTCFKPGVTLGCPKVKPGTVGICVERCSGDNDCPAGHLCCSNGCGHTCQPGVILKCPKLQPGTVGICVERCSGDNDCPAGYLCCSNGCGHTCQQGQ